MQNNKLEFVPYMLLLTYLNLYTLVSYSINLAARLLVFRFSYMSSWFSLHSNIASSRARARARALVAGAAGPLVFPQSG